MWSESQIFKAKQIMVQFYINIKCLIFYRTIHNRIWALGWSSYQLSIAHQAQIIILPSETIKKCPYRLWQFIISMIHYFYNVNTRKFSLFIHPKIYVRQKDSDAWRDSGFKFLESWSIDSTQLMKDASFASISHLSLSFFLPLFSPPNQSIRFASPLYLSYLDPHLETLLFSHIHIAFSIFSFLSSLLCSLHLSWHLKPTITTLRSDFGPITYTYDSYDHVDGSYWPHHLF